MEENNVTGINNQVSVLDLLNRVNALAATFQTNTDPMNSALVEMLTAAEFEDDDAKVDAISSITEVYRIQAVTLQQMLSLIDKMYNDIRNTKKSE